MSEPLSHLSIRPYRPADRSALEELWAQVFPDDPPWNAPARMIDTKLRVQPELLLVGEVGTQLVGAVMAGFDGVRGWIHHLAVAPEFRRHGFATQLMQTAEVGLRRLGCTKVNLQGPFSQSERDSVLPHTGIRNRRPRQHGTSSRRRPLTQPPSINTHGRSDRRCLGCITGDQTRCHCTRRCCRLPGLLRALLGHSALRSPDCPLLLAMHDWLFSGVGFTRACSEGELSFKLAPAVVLVMLCGCGGRQGA